MTQDYSVLQRTRSRIRFLSEFTTTVLASLQKTPMDPFSGNIADVNALAWGFAAASSRALRDIPSAASTQYIDKSSARIIDTTTVATIGDGTATTGIESTTKQGESSGTATVVPLEATAPPSGPVMIPMIDFASHSFAPSCAVRDTGTEYVLYTVRPVRSGEELTINYGALSNAELLDDYGFTVDNNPYDSIRVKVDDVLINTARAVMGQSNYSTSVLGGADGSKRSIAASSSDGANWVPDKSTGSLSASGPYIPQYTGKQSTAVSVGIVSAQQSRPYSDRSLREWQKVWLQCLDMDNIGTLPKEVTFGSLARVEHARGVTQAAAKDANPRHTIDPRLLAFLRVIYSTHEADLLVHGYTPFTLQSSGSMLAAPVEAHVTRTLIGMLFLVLRSYGTSLVQDVKLMKTGLVEAPQDPLKPKEELALKGIPAPATKQGGLSLALYQHGWFGDNSLSSSLLHVDTATLRGECRQVLQDCLQAPNPAFATRDRASAQDQVHVPATPTVAEASAAQVTQIPPTSGFDVQINTAAHASAIIHSTQRGSVDTNLLYLASGSESISGIDVAADAEVVDLANIMRQMGQKLPVNVREAYKFRIRRKKLLRDLMLQLADLYEVKLCTQFLFTFFKSSESDSPGGFV